MWDVMGNIRPMSNLWINDIEVVRISNHSSYLLKMAWYLFKRGLKYVLLKNN